MSKSPKKDGLLQPILPKVNHARDNEKATPAEIEVELAHQNDMRRRAGFIRERLKMMGVKVVENKEPSPLDGSPAVEE